MRLFLHGTLLDPKTLATRGGDPPLPMRRRDGALRGWRRVSLAGTPWPTSRRSLGCVTAGQVVMVGASALRRLTTYEGPAYRLHRVVLEPCLSAWTWIAPGGTRRP